MEAPTLLRDLQPGQPLKVLILLFDVTGFFLLSPGLLRDLLSAGPRCGMSWLEGRGATPTSVRMFGRTYESHSVSLLMR